MGNASCGGEERCTPGPSPLSAASRSLTWFSTRAFSSVVATHFASRARWTMAAVALGSNGFARGDGRRTSG